MNTKKSITKKKRPAVKIKAQRKAANNNKRNADVPVKKYNLRYSMLAFHQAELANLTHLNDEGKFFFEMIKKNKEEGLTKAERKEFYKVETKLKLSRKQMEAVYK